MHIIVAADKNWAIGRNNELLVRISNDMKNFRRLTEGNVVVMGRKTLESFPGGRPLKNRINIVLTRNEAYHPEGVTVCRSREETLKLLNAYAPEDVFILGGGMIYREFLADCEKAYVTHIFADFEADTDFPNLDADPAWHLAETGERREDNGIFYEFRVYERRRGVNQ